LFNSIKKKESGIIKVFKKICKFIIWFLLILLFIYNLYTFISINVLKKDLASINGYATLEVVSGSMEPTIDTGDLIVINQKDKKYNKNDIITFKDVNSSYVTHRIIKIDGKKIITKGDNNNSKDEGYITKDKIVGKYVFKINKMGFLVKSIKNPVTLTIIFIIGIIICIIISTDKDGIPLDISEEEKKYLKAKEKAKKVLKKKNKSKKRK